MAFMPQGCIKVPGLNQRITDPDLTKSFEFYNKLPEILEVFKRPQLSKIVLNKFCGLIRELGLDGHVGVHESHSHGTLADNHVMIGEDFEKPLCRRIQQVPLSKVANMDFSNIYGRLFALDDDGLFHPYEYQRGTIPENIQELVSKLIPRYIHLVKTHNLGSTISLEILSKTFSQPMSEIVWQSEVTLWESKRVMQRNLTRATGFIASHEGYACSSNWVGTEKGHAEVIPDPGSKLPDLYELENQLVLEGSLRPREPPGQRHLKSLL
ncbi:hypothetical protein FOPG_16492 [Fusarium oxysporum f. sp. conglutinans race 2 54008]|uniref:Uncharacterized protein n=2 Tax=Fusarium oxysporum f. sp. conglutinans TaxID=100902 RepID=A0A8H6G8S2_FUSOX|nr:hypothetical protein FOPG_16492 [Fusarium oxysporum f. sp. conglutinans race 2 54008]KAF6513066.1 hypothetical protein HZS61_007324 [Fusarium oxysporum f. sp. conglutinans]